jgi:hypothetical protein
MTYLVTNEKMLLFLFLSVIYSKLYVENFTLKVMPKATAVANFSTKLPISYFLANLKFRYWNNKVPIMLGGETFEPSYYFEAISRDQYLALKSLYDDILFREYVTDPSIPPQERLKVYTTVMKPLEGKEDGIILQSIKADLKLIESKSSVKKNKPSSNTQGRSFHTSSANTFPIEDGGLGENPNSRISEEVRLALGNDLNPGIRDLLERIPLSTYNFGEFVGVNPENPTVPTNDPDTRLLRVEEVLERILSTPEVKALTVDEIVAKLLAGEDNSSSGSVNPQVGSGHVFINQVLENILNDRNNIKMLTLEEQQSRQEHNNRMQVTAEKEAQNAAEHRADVRAEELQRIRDEATHARQMEALQLKGEQDRIDAAIVRRAQQATRGDIRTMGRRVARAAVVAPMFMYSCDAVYGSWTDGTFGAVWDSVTKPSSGGESKTGN